MNPRATVIVPVRNRRDLLVKLLDSLEQQTFRDFEVVVVDDGSTDGADMEASGREIGGRPVRLLRSGGAGAVTARRLGVAESSGEILAFTDSDCVTEPGWLQAGVAALEAGNDMVNGLTRAARQVGPLERSLESATEGLYPTCNMFFRRSTYERFGGFDEQARDRLRFRVNQRARGTGFGEDTIFAWQMIRAGVAYTHAPDAIVVHHVFPADPVEWLSRGVQMAAFPALVREVPELKKTLLRRSVLLGSRSRIPAYSAAVAVALRSPRLVAGCTAWWALWRLRDLRRMPRSWRSRVAWLPAEMALDTVVGTALVVGSIRSRTIVI